MRPKKLLAKRCFDLAMAVLFVVVFSPVLVILGVLVRLLIGKPALFRQRRPGLHGRPFTMLKFRTMTDETDETGKLLPDEHRLTPFGNFLRSTSLDELPELFNVIAGDMSLVGPRPLLMEYLPRYTPEQARRHEVMPGITGWAQINGRNALSWETKFALDAWYVEHWRLGLDMKILAATLLCVLRRKDISSNDHATMPKFAGSAEWKPTEKQ